MRLSRYASRRNHGATTIFADANLRDNLLNGRSGLTYWCTHEKEIALCVLNVRDAALTTQHNYHVHLSLDDIMCLLQLLADIASGNTRDSSDDAALIRRTLQDHISSIVQLLACGTGVLPAAPEESEVPAKAKGKSRGKGNGKD